MSNDQFDLFGSIPASRTARRDASDASGGAAEGVSGKSATSDRVVPVSLDDTLANVAARIPAGVHLGTSSWGFPGWKGLIYGQSYSDSVLSRRGLSAYAAHPLMRTVGIDRTFYGPISEADFRSYAAQAKAAAPGFRFLVKAPMLFTGPRLRSDDGRWSDNGAFLNPGLATAQFVLPATRGLADACGPLVFQFPPLGPRFTRSPARFADALAEFLLALPVQSGSAFYSVEVRDPELLTDDYVAALCAGRATHCIAIHARMPSPLEQARFWREPGRAPLVIRWSLHSGLKYEQAKERYAPFDRLVDEDPEGRTQVAQLVNQAVQDEQSAYVIVNNKAEGSAPLSIRKLADLIAEYGETIVIQG
jgi:uncharacterized protein YecE (DUF72 family)